MAKIKHGEAGKKSPEYEIWKGIRARCYTKTHKNYPQYGGRGIAMSNSWKSSYLNFLNDMGRKPASNYSIERIDVSLGYNKDNCIWIPKSNQNKNKRTSINIIYGSKSWNLADVCKELKLSYYIMRYRITDLKMTFEEALRIKPGTILNPKDQRGVNNPTSKLTKNDVIFIYKADSPRKELAKKYGIARTTVDNIKNKKCYKEILVNIF